LLESLPDVFYSQRRNDKRDQEALTSELYQQIGQLKVELDWLKKNGS
jgi:putative transposase